MEKSKTVTLEKYNKAGEEGKVIATFEVSDAVAKVIMKDDLQGKLHRIVKGNIETPKNGKNENTETK